MSVLREWLYWNQESAYKTPVTTPVLNTNAIFVRLDQGNAFTMRPKTQRVAIPFGGGRANTGLTASGTTELVGTLKLILCYSQAGFILPAISLPINNAQTAPYTTTEPPRDLASFAIYHGVALSNGTVKRRVYLGTKSEGWQLDASRQSQTVSLTVNLRASTPQGNQFDGSVDPTTSAFSYGFSSNP